jgi:MinD superfamily P-loop ATPase
MLTVVVASGKGGTGKTLVATSLALVAAEVHPCTLVDADVEAPNAALFVHPTLDTPQPVERLIPEVNAARCTHCGRCSQVCQYHAIAALPSKTLVFGDLCHGCGSCTLQCPEQAIREVPLEIGFIETGHSGALAFAQGTLAIGQAMATPVIRQLKRYVRDADNGRDHLTILDAPPGTACPVVETLRGADFALLVTEPTTFGLHDLKLAVEVACDVLGLRLGLVLNKEAGDCREVESYCRAKRIPILLRIPLDRRIAEAYSVGIPLVEALPAYRPRFVHLWQRIGRLVQKESA